MSVKMVEYLQALEGAGPRMKELILAQAARDKSLDWREVRELARRAYPEPA